MPTIDRTLISAAELTGLRRARHAGRAARLQLRPGRPRGRRARLGRGHLPGAHYVHLDRDLSGAKTGRNGRHPLPEPDGARRARRRLGRRARRAGGVLRRAGRPYAARAWWLLRWLGHDAVAVLDGGLPAWPAAGGALDARHRAGRGRCAPYPLLAPAMPTVEAADAAGRAAARRPLLDARAGERFRGEVEPLDPVAGHIPGALNRFFKDNLQRRRPLQAGRRAARRVRAPCSAAPTRPSCTSAARASPPATTCWRWSTPGSAARRCTRARGASGAPTRRGRSRGAEPESRAAHLTQVNRQLARYAPSAYRHSDACRLPLKESRMYKRILVPTDGSEITQKAVAAAIATGQVRRRRRCTRSA